MGTTLAHPRAFIADRPLSTCLTSCMLLTITLGLVTGCGGGRQPTSHSEARHAPIVLRRGLGGEPGSLDPAAAVDTFSYEVLGDLYEGLTAELADGTLIPGVAASWTVDATGRQYTFTLRSDARWSNGALVTAQDFVNAWRRVLDPATSSGVADNLRLLQGAEAIIAGKAPVTSLGVTAISDTQLQVNLVKPAPYFPQLLTHPSAFPIFSNDAAKSRGGPNWVSNGAYVLSSWTPGNVVRLTKNIRYWNQSAVHIDQVDYVPESDEGAELRQYRAGQLDITDTVPPAALAMIRARMPDELHVTPYLATSYYEFNLRRPPFRNNLELRAALSMAIDRKVQLASVLQFGQQPAFGLVPQGVWNYKPQRWSWQALPDEARRQQARQHYANAGYSREKPLKIRLLYNENSNIKDIAIAVAAMWKEVLGVDTDLQSEEFRVYLGSRKDPSRWDVVRFGWTADYNDAGNFLDTLRSDSPNNDSGYQNAAYDRLMNQASETADPNARRALLEQAEALMLADYPICPLYVFSAKRLFKPYVSGEAVNPLNRLYSKYLVIAPH